MIKDIKKHTLWGDDSSVSNNQNWFLVLMLQMLLNVETNLSESSEGSVWDSHEEVLSSSAVSLFIVDVMNGVDKDDAKVLLQALLVELEVVEVLGNVFLKVGWFLSVFLNYLISSIEHVCFN